MKIIPPLNSSTIKAKGGGKQANIVSQKKKIFRQGTLVWKYRDNQGTRIIYLRCPDWGLA